jgi:hypothetical protein
MVSCRRCSWGSVVYSASRIIAVKRFGILCDSGEATGGLEGLNPPLASRITPGIRTKPQRNFFGKGVGVPHYLASAYLKS